MSLRSRLATTSVALLVASLALAGGAAHAQEVATWMLFKKTSFKAEWGSGPAATKGFYKVTQELPGANCGAPLGPTFGWSLTQVSVEGFTPALQITGGLPAVVTTSPTGAANYFANACKPDAVWPVPSFGLIGDINIAGWLIQRNAFFGTYNWDYGSGDGAGAITYHPPVSASGYVDIKMTLGDYASPLPGVAHFVRFLDPLRPPNACLWLNASTGVIHGVAKLQTGNYTVRVHIGSTSSDQTQDFVVSAPSGGKTNYYTLAYVSNNSGAWYGIRSGQDNTTDPPPNPFDPDGDGGWQPDDTGTGGSTGGGTYTGPPSTDSWWTRMFVPTSEGTNPLKAAWGRLAAWGPFGYVSTAKAAWDAGFSSSQCGTVEANQQGCGMLIDVGSINLFGDAPGANAGANPVHSYIDFRPELPEGQHYNDGYTGTTMGSVIRYVRLIMGALVYVMGFFGFMKWMRPKVTT